MLVNGTWQGKWHPYQGQDRQGRYLRQDSTVRHWITRDGNAGPTGKAGFAAEADRYHLYVALICPWACRTLMARQIKGLEGLISVSIVHPVIGSHGWSFEHFPGSTEDHLYRSNVLHQLYTRQDPYDSGRVPVPVLWDKKKHRMVNNESADIVRMLNDAFEDLAPSEIDLYPPAHRDEIDRLNRHFYHELNNGVYRAGFARSQTAYDEAVNDVFSALDDLDSRLNGGRFLFGEQLTETDIRLFVTLIRFDLAYHGLFKCNRKRITDYPYISRYLRELYHLPGIAKTVNPAHIVHGYYGLKQLNPSGIIPTGPELSTILAA